ncbi:MAG TPA: SDR family NAD(P)-dependent oxidoreductase [Xanthomonadaceae bacterium]|nr:SDR family NAD(P)-dependent oxidoreductase [Xanthomonadaceae bacterium]
MSTVLITGANRGIGLALAAHHAARGDSVIAVCRHTSHTLDGLGVQVEAGVDVTRAEDLARLADKLEGIAIDRVMLNAGVLERESLGAIDEEAAAAIRRQFEVNALAPLRVVDALLDRLNEGARIGIVTSRMGSVADNSSGGYYGYRMSKAAVNAAGRSLAIDLKPRGIAVFLLHPGFVQTDMVGGHGDISAAAAAATLVARMDELGIEQTGSFWHARREPLPW